MPPKGKKKRASLRLGEDGQISDSEEKKGKKAEEKKTPPVRQVVEVVEEENALDESIETIKKDVDEIEDAVETVEDEIEEMEAKVPDEPAEPAVSEKEPDEEPVSRPEPEDTKSSVESLFVKSTSPVTPDITVVGKRDKSVGVWVGATLGVVLAIGVSLIFLVKGPGSLPFMAPAPTPTPTEAPVPTPTPAAELTRADITVSVLNGGGTPGAAGKMKEFLESKGYTVDSVGNADEYTYTETTVNAKSGKEKAADLVKEDLASDYTVASETGTVAADASYDVQVIVGEE